MSSTGGRSRDASSSPGQERHGQDGMEHEPLLAILRAADRSQAGDLETAMGEGHVGSIFDE